LAVVKRLLQDPRVDPSAFDNEALIQTIENRLPYQNEAQQLKMIEILLKDPRVDPSALDNEALRLASEAREFAVVERLLEDKRVDPNTHKNLALKAAITKGDFKLIKRIAQDERVDLLDDAHAVITLARQYKYQPYITKYLEDMLLKKYNRYVP